MVASLQKSHFHDLEILSRSRYSNRAVESLIMNNDNKPPARTEKRKPQDGKLQSYLEWPNCNVAIRARVKVRSLHMYLFTIKQ